jgi:hypothetical protein
MMYPILSSEVLLRVFSKCKITLSWIGSEGGYTGASQVGGATVESRRMHRRGATVESRRMCQAKPPPTARF